MGTQVPLRVIFMGTAELACPSLEALARDPAFAVTAVVTQPDRPKGRELKLAASPVKEVAVRLNLPALQPERARRPEFIETLKALQPGMIVVAAYGQILPPAMLELPRHGCINVHASLLPKYRGAGPIQWAILNGEPETGVTIMQMDAGLDTGPILTQATTPITPEDTAQTLHDRLARMGAELLVKTIPEYVSGKLVPQPQPAEGATYARKITKEDGHLDWTQPAGALFNRIRGLVPWPGAFTYRHTGNQRSLLKIWSARVEPKLSGKPGIVLSADKTGVVVACGEGALRLLTLQREGGKKLGAGEFLLGHSILPGESLC